MIFVDSTIVCCLTSHFHCNSSEDKRLHLSNKSPFLLVLFSHFIAGKHFANIAKCKTKIKYIHRVLRLILKLQQDGCHIPVLKTGKLYSRYHNQGCTCR